MRLELMSLISEMGLGQIAIPDAYGRLSLIELAKCFSLCGRPRVPVRCDHTVEAEVEALFQQMRSELGRLDLLVNNFWGGYEQHEFDRFTAPFWEQPLRH